MTRQLLALSGVVISAALASGCGTESFPVSPTPVASSAVVVQGTKYQGNIALSTGGTTSFNMTLIARELSGVARVAPRANTPAVTGSFETGSGLKGTVQGTLTGSLDSGRFEGSLIGSSAGRTSEQRYSGPITTSSAALAPGDCVQGTCAADGLTGAIQAAQVPIANGPPPPPPCAYALSPATVSVAGSGGTTSTTITTTPNCAWAAVSTAPWITIAGAAAGTGVGTVTFSVEANTAVARQGDVRIADQTFRINQAVIAGCTNALNPTTQSVPAAGGSFSAALTTSCAWTVSSDVPWITVTAGGSGTTSGTIAYAVASNSNAATRTGQLTVQGGGGTVTLTVTQAGTGPSITVNPATASITNVAQTGTASVAATVSWTAASDQPWLTITAGASGGAGTSTLTYAATANPGAASRNGTIALSGGGAPNATLTVTQAGTAPPPCTYALNPSTQSVVAAGGTFSTVLTTSCAWTVSSDMPWITVSSGGSGTTSGTINYVVASNSNTAARTGHLTVQGSGGTATLTMNQEGTVIVPAITVTPPSVNLTSGAQTGTASVTANVNWTAASDQTWLTITAGASGGTGTTTLTYAVTANTGTTARTGTITVSGGGAPNATLTVTQAGTGPSITVNPATASITNVAQTGTASVTANVNWTAASDQTWLTITAGASGGAGTSTLTYAATANPGPTSRTAVITLSGGGAPNATLTVNQAGTDCTILIYPPGGAVVPASGGSVQKAIDTSCSWTASSNVPWMTVAPSSGTGDGTIVITVAANPGTTARTGVITVSGVGAPNATMTVTQTGTTPPASITVNPTTANVASGAQTGLTASVTANVNWTAASNQTWLTITGGASGGSGTSTLTYAVMANTGTTSRMGVITLSGGGAPNATLTVTQTGTTPPASITVNPTTANVASGAQTGLTASVTANVNWTAASNQTWLTITGGASGGSGTSTLTYAVMANTGTTSRMGVITLSGGGAPNATLTVTQAAPTPAPVPSIVVTPLSGTRPVTFTVTGTGFTPAGMADVRVVRNSNGAIEHLFSATVNSGGGFTGTFEFLTISQPGTFAVTATNRATMVVSNVVTITLN